MSEAKVGIQEFVNKSGPPIKATIKFRIDDFAVEEITSSKEVCTLDESDWERLKQVSAEDRLKKQESKEAFQSKVFLL